MAVPIRDELATRRPPIATWGLILANVVVFLFLQPPIFQSGAADSANVDVSARDEREATEFIYRFGVVPC